MRGLNFTIYDKKKQEIQKFVYTNLRVGSW